MARLFHTLASVQMVDGCALGWATASSSARRSPAFRKTNTHYMNTYEDPAIRRSFAMSDFDMDSSELITADWIPGISEFEDPR